MNHHQKTYALKRLTEIQSLKLKEAREKYEIKQKLLPNNQRIDLIYAGKVKLLPREDVNEWTNLAKAYDFSKYEIKHGFDKNYDVVCKSINSIAQQAKDQIMLGDCDEALKLLSQLENIKV